MRTGAPFLLAALAVLPSACTTPAAGSPFEQTFSLTPAELALPLVPRPGQPRLERVSLASCEFLPNDRVEGFLYIQASNLDDHSVVLINGEVVPTTSREALKNDLLGIDPVRLSYAVTVYHAFAAAFTRASRGETLEVIVVTDAGDESNALLYTLPESPELMDSDGDALLDIWELEGFDPDDDGPLPRLDLPGLGADPYRPDVFVELDVMKDIKRPPLEAALKIVQAAFADAPIMNPDARPGQPARPDGIALHIDAAGTVPYIETMGFVGNRPQSTADPGFRDVFRNFYELKQGAFDAEGNREHIYHYGIWGAKHIFGFSGESDAATNATDTDFIGPGNDFMVTLDGHSHHFSSVRSQAETLMHELGHNFMLRHGGTNHTQHKENYHSVMTYSWQLRTSQASSFRKQHKILDEMYYGESGVREALSKFFRVPTTRVFTSYSEGMGLEDHPNWFALDYRGPMLKGNREPDDRPVLKLTDIQLQQRPDIERSLRQVQKLPLELDQ